MYSLSESVFKLLHVVGVTIKDCWKENGREKLIFIALGIISLFVYVGILQEKIMSGCYGDDTNENCTNGEKFKYELTLVLIKNIFALIFVQVSYFIKPEKRTDSTHSLFYASAATASSFAAVSVYMALRFVTFPMQVVVKSAKPLSVMLMACFLGIRYKIQRYFFVLIIVIGVMMFKLFESKNQFELKEDSEHNLYHLYGIGLLVSSLLSDGVLGGIQDRMNTNIKSPSFRQMMFSTCAWSCALLSAAIILSGEMFEIIGFIGRHSNVVWHLGTLGLADAMGSAFTFAMISSFGSLACSITTTVRKLFSIIFSIIFFGHSSTSGQWLGAALVFCGLFADAIFGKHKTKDNNKEDDINCKNKTTETTKCRQTIFSIS